METGRGAGSAGRARIGRLAPLLALLAGFEILFFWTLPRYGVTYDEALGELYLGDKYLRFWGTLDPGFLDPERRDIALYARPDHPDFYGNARHARRYASHVWGFGPLVSSVTKEILYTRLGLMDPIDAHHASLGFLVGLQVVALYLFAARELGELAAFTAGLVLLAYPRYWAHLHNNTKDVPEAVLYTLALLWLHRGVTRASPGSVLGAAVAWGLALATKANALFLPFTAAPWLGCTLLERRRRGERLLGRGVGLALLASPLVAGALFLLGWPYLLVRFPERLLYHLSYLLARGGEGPPRWQIEPLRNALATMPLPVLALGAAGLLVMAREVARGGERRSLHLLLLAWLVLPILRVSVPGARDFDVIRHWLEFVPALALVGGLGAARLWEGLRRRLPAWRRDALGRLLVCAWLAPVLAWNATRHPFELVFYNRLAGGLGGAQARGWGEATDYWGSSYREGLRWLDGSAERGAILFVGVGEHIVRLVAKTWLRPDLELMPIAWFDQVRPAARAARRSVYLMYVTRPGHYAPPVEQWDGRVAPVHEIAVDGGVILRILRLPEG